MHVRVPAGVKPHDDSAGRRARALAILDEASQILDGWRCEASTECCRFSVTGREPWVTQVEWDLVKDELKRQGRRLPHIPEDDDGRCPFLDDAGRCVVYASRPLGCRTFFCERARGPHDEVKLDKRDQGALRALPRELEALTVDVKGEDAGARPIRSWLRQELGGLKGAARRPSARASRRR